jgi:lysophospholipase L1-like esterase
MRNRLMLMTVGVSAVVGLARVDCARAQDAKAGGQGHILAFGDSITYGVGDGENPGDYVDEITDAGEPRGYPLRLSASGAGVVSNAGNPGEELLRGGMQRFPDVVVGTDVDMVVFMEGVNDAVQRAEATEYRTAVQRVINVARAEGKTIVLSTLPPPTAIHGSLAPYTNLYSSIVRDLAVLNDATVADVEQKFLTACPDMTTCSLYNLPEGLHPNTAGYDAITEVIKAAVGK